MKILYCKIGWANQYNGDVNDKPERGGEYTKENIGAEIHNFKNAHGSYYGFVETSSINIEEKLGAAKNAESVDDVLAVWVSTKATGGQYVVGWYKNATVYKRMQTVPQNVLAERELKTITVYNIFSKHVRLLKPEERTYKIEGMGRSHLWYGNEAANEQVLRYITDFEANGVQEAEKIKNIEVGTKKLFGAEKEAVVKVRINQGEFRNNLLQKYKHCCLCGVKNPGLLIASHIKPWAESNPTEKLDAENGFLLCPNHDKLFDTGLISFDENGMVLISDVLTEEDRQLMHIEKGTKITVSKKTAEYLAYHRKHVFRNLTT